MKIDFDKLAAFEARLEYPFANRDLLLEALTHRSAATRDALQGGRLRSREAASIIGNGNERLEFLGDRVLGLIVAEMLLEAFPYENEGLIARRHAELVRRETLAIIADEIGLVTAIRIPPEEDQNVRRNPGLLADACEAVIAALYLDGGLEAARRFVFRYWKDQMTATLVAPKDPKTTLQEWAQGRGLKLPDYAMLRTEGPPHQPIFTVEVSVEGGGVAQATGPSKRVAERLAAETLLARLMERGGS